MENGISSGSSNIEAQIRRVSKKFEKLSLEGQYGYNYIPPYQSPAFYPSFNEEHTTGLQNFPSALTFREFYRQYGSFQRVLLELEEPGNEEFNYFDYYINSTPSSWISGSGMPENQQMVQPYGIFAPSTSIPGSGMPENQQRVQPYLFAPSTWIMPAENEQMVQLYGPVTHNLIQQVTDEAPPKRRRVGGYNFGEGPSTQLQPQPAVEELNLELKLYVGELDLALKL